METPYDLPRRERERLMRREQMLTSAEAVFAEKGYARATLDEIAQRAEFGKGTLYNYFDGGKEEILFAIFDRLYDDLRRIIDETLSPELVAERPFRDVFDGFLKAIFGYFLEGQDRFLIMIKEGHRWVFDEEAADKAAYFQTQSERVVEGMLPGITAAIAKGEIKAFPPHAIVHMIMGNIKGYQMHMCLEMCRCGPAAGDRKAAAASGSKGRVTTGDGLRPLADDDPTAEIRTNTEWSMPTPQDSARFIASFLLDGLLVNKN